mmetsp:Transcript_30303/g.80255  ORF Transcript_30303/g.80255 Transcript_30303/m.80255 type:complete len:314 (+) Transcript_30303:165-1106(+)
MGILSKGITKYYDIGKTIGKGSFATVKEGTRKDTGQKVAIKVIDKKDAVFDAESLEQEIATMKKVNHPNCVALHGVFDESSKTYLVLDLITGGTVMDRIIANDHFSEKDAASVTADVLNAIHYLHSIGITHRDLKPENLLYASNDPDSPDYNTIKVADFGLAKFVTENSVMKTTCGTPGYVAPEVLDPYLPFTNGYGPEVDLWSMGVVLYIMLCGFPPFYDDSTAVLFKQVTLGVNIRNQSHFLCSRFAKESTHSLPRIGMKFLRARRTLCRRCWLLIPPRGSLLGSALTIPGSEMREKHQPRKCTALIVLSF